MAGLIRARVEHDQTRIAVAPLSAVNTPIAALACHPVSIAADSFWVYGY